PEPGRQLAGADHLEPGAARADFRVPGDAREVFPAGSRQLAGVGVARPVAVEAPVNGPGVGVTAERETPTRPPVFPVGGGRVDGRAGRRVRAARVRPGL